MDSIMKKKSEDEIATDNELAILREKLETEIDVFERCKIRRRIKYLEDEKGIFLEARRTWR